MTNGLNWTRATDNDTGEYVINALDMSDTMERIFEEYESMEE